MKIAYVGRSDYKDLSIEEKNKWIKDLNRNSDIEHIFASGTIPNLYLDLYEEIKK